MIENNIDHIGIAVNDLEKVKAYYLEKGYEIVDTIYDETQLATLCLLHKNNENNIELIYTDNPKSPVYNLCKNNEEKEYHVCYQVSSISDSLSHLKSLGYKQISNVAYAKLLKGNICFLYSKDKTLIELVEVNNE
ncbi:MAG: VOC family protein [Bacilli bacterium]|nr:VOC family protein [Bacilli bacterium]MDD4809218.1 VOC family protein [Bacilli bacterium]